MILCVTLNPCLDKSLDVPHWEPGDNVRGLASGEIVGGKGNNVARALKRLGREARPVTFFGGPVGDRCERLLREVDGLDPVVISTDAPTRVILTVRTALAGDPPATAFFDPDPAITATEAGRLVREVEILFRSGDVEALCLSGSSPSPATHDVFSELIAIAKGRRVPSFLDTYGPPLSSLWGVWPDSINLNRREAGVHLRAESPSDEALWALLEGWSKHGVRSALVTNGADPVLALIEGRRYLANPPLIKPVNPIGSGDCLLAGLIAARLDRSTPADCLRTAVGSGVANALVWGAGEINHASVIQLASQVVIHSGLRGSERTIPSFVESRLRVEDN